MITKVINVNLHQPIYEKITAKRGDIASRYLLFHLLDGDKPFDLTGKTVRVYAIKPDGKEVFNDLVVNDTDKGYCTLELTSQMLALAGIVKMELVVTELDKKLTSIPFNLEVLPSINSKNAIVSTNEFTALINALASLSEYDNYKNEIEGARGANLNLKERLDNFDSQLEHIESRKNALINNTIIKLFNKETVTGVCIGDSIVYGVSENGRANKPYPMLLQERLRSIFKNNNLTILNAGISGNTSTQGVSRFKTDVLDKKPDFVIIGFGINDGKDDGVTSYAKYRSNVEEMVKLAQENGIDVILLSPIPTFYANNSNRLSWTCESNKRIYRYGEVCREIAISKKVCFLDLGSIISELISNKKIEFNEFYTTDTVHVLQKGYYLISDIISAHVFDNISYINSKKDKLNYVPIANSKYISTDIVKNSTVLKDYQMFKYHTSLKNDGVEGTYLEFEFYNDVKGSNLYLIAPRSTVGGRVIFHNIHNEDEIKNEINQYYNTNHIVDNKYELFKNLDIGYHKVRVDYIDITSVNTTGLYAMFSAFVIENTTDNYFYNIRSLNKRSYKNILSNTIIENDKNGYNVELFGENISKSFNKLRIKFKGELANGHSLCFCMNKAYNDNIGVCGYVLNRNNEYLRLQKIDINGSISILANEVANDISEININIDNNGNIQCLVNESELFNVNDISYNNGYFGFHHYTLNVVEKSIIEKFEYIAY